MELDPIVCADVLDWCAEYEGPKFHALFADAPYEYGFMSRSWDETGITYQSETWAALAEHLYPGAFLMVFGGARSWHRLAVAMEDAGLTIHPTIFCWAQGSGFPKATRIDTQIDKAAGKLGEREIIGPNLNARPNSGRTGGIMGEARGRVFNTELTNPATDLARAWEGHRYGLQALKPAVEPIIVAQKPYSGKPVDNIVSTGAGALWIDGARVGTAADHPGVHKSYSNELHAGWRRPWRDNRPPEYAPTPKGRWPPNFALCHVPSHKICQSCQAVHPAQPIIEVCPDCGGELERVEGCKRVGVKRVKGHSPGNKKPTNSRNLYGEYAPEMPHIGYADPDGRETVADWDCRESCPARRLGEQSGESVSRSAVGVRRFGRSGGIMGKQGDLRDGRPEGHNDKGTAARFYPQAGWEHEEMECCESCPVAKLDEQAGERPGDRPGRAPRHNRQSITSGKGIYGKFNDQDTVGYKDSGGASRFYPNADWIHEVAERLAEADPARYCPKAAKKERSKGLDDFFWCRDKESPTGFARVNKEEWEALPKRQRAQGNIHPTVKPIALLKWLATLLLPPQEYAPRRILIPFAGSGSEVIAAMMANWEEVIGIEILQDYVDIANERIEKARLEMAQMEMAI